MENKIIFDYDLREKFCFDNLNLIKYKFYYN